ncbi:MAG TPA: NAD(+)/NADH kinase [Firmicutes bacterium]|nr:NAD(+)/NADH kinase [Candidatus Fermentithermobacillaceae bacterium]
MKRIGIFPNLEKTGTSEVCLELVRYLGDRNEEAVLPPAIAGALGLEKLSFPVERWGETVRLALILGGDGTLLSAARALAPQAVPLLGVNFGHFGFLSEIERNDLFRELPRFLQGDFILDPRLMLEVVVLRGEERVFKALCLNEVCVLKELLSRIAVISVFAGDSLVETYLADGIIVATPTGSTAYSLSAGGPILHPSVDALIVTPVCPHSLSSRSVVSPSATVLRVESREENQKMHLSVDGQISFVMEPGDRAFIKAYERPALLVRNEGWSFYEVLRRKMKEGGEKPTS